MARMEEYRRICHARTSPLTGDLIHVPPAGHPGIQSAPNHSKGTDQPPVKPSECPESGNELIGGIVFNALLTRIGVAMQSRLVVDERGAAGVEHGLIIGLVVVVIIGAAGTLGGMLLGWLDGDGAGLSAP